MASQYSSKVIGIVGFGGFAAGAAVMRLLGCDPVDLATTRRSHAMGWGIAWDFNHDRGNDAHDQLVSLNPDWKPPKPRIIVLVRHGHYQCEGSGFKHEDRMLTSKGRQQAQLVGDWLRSTFGKRIVRISSSDFLRAEETARIIAERTGRPLGPSDARLRECCPTFPEPCHDEKSQELFKRYAPGQSRHICLMDHAADLDSAWDEYFHRPKADTESGQVHVIVCHSNVMRYLALRALQAPPERWRVMPHIGHCHCVLVKLYWDGQIHLYSINEGEHIPSGLRSHSNLKGRELSTLATSIP